MAEERIQKLVYRIQKGNGGRVEDQRSEPWSPSAPPEEGKPQRSEPQKCEEK
jgi:hypothetical protein